MDWNHLHSFLATAENGSLSGAARHLGSSQPTVGRHIAELEQQLEVRLFDRTARGLRLTPLGATLVEHARQMRSGADDLLRVASGHSGAVEGTVRLTTSEMMAAFFLPRLITRLRIEQPAIDVELVASNLTENLLQREADVAVRMYRPTQTDVITRKIGEFRLGIYAHADYLAHRGSPTDPSDLADHDILGYDKSDDIIRGFGDAGMDIDRSFFAIRCDNHIVNWNFLVAGAGIGFAPRRLGDAERDLVRLDFTEVPTTPIWLTAHRDLMYSRRIRLVYDFLAETLPAACL